MIVRRGGPAVTRWLRWLGMVALVGTTVVFAEATSTAAVAQSEAEDWGRLERAYDGKFTFVRLRWGAGGRWPRRTRGSR